MHMYIYIYTHTHEQLITKYMQQTTKGFFYHERGLSYPLPQGLHTHWDERRPSLYPKIRLKTIGGCQSFSH